MLVRNLHAWAGADFSFRPGEIIELDEDIAAARIDAGLCDLPPAPPVPPTMPVKAVEVEAAADDSADAADSADTPETKKKKK